MKKTLALLFVVGLFTGCSLWQKPSQTDTQIPPVVVKNEIPVATPSAPENNPPKTPDAVKKPQKPIEPIKKDPKTDEVLDEFDALLDAIVAE